MNQESRSMNRINPTSYKLQATHSSRGFTLVEMIVAVFLFSIVMVVAVGALVSIVQANRKAQSVKSVMNNLNFSLESMTRAIRTGTAYDCPGSCQTAGSDSFSFLDKDGRNITYSYGKNGDTGQIFRAIGTADAQALTAPEVKIDSLQFYLRGESAADDVQPRVLIVVKGTAGPDDKTRTEFSLQTLVTQRILDR